MPSVRYYNNSAPFWDFVADFEQQQAAGNHNNATHGDPSDDENASERPIPWAQGWTGFPWGTFPHRGRHASHPHHHREGPPAPTVEDEKEEGEAGPSEPKAPEDGPRHRGHHGHHRGGSWARGGGGPCGRGRGFGFGPRGRGHFHPYAAAAPWANLAETFAQQFFGAEDNATTTTTKDKNEDFKPEADVFDTPEAFVIHVSLPGAKKEDVGVNWDAEKSELSIAGVTYRPGDEEFLKTLALDERKVGAFERKVRLGSRANPAQVDVDGISARMEDGVLTVEVPKLDAEYVEIKKVDIE